MKDGITTVMFDLDGTLLPMDLDKFTKTYFGLLAQAAQPLGFEAGALVDAVWKGTGAMMKNDGSLSNCERFWQVFCQMLGEGARVLQPRFDDFYAHEFNGARAACGENPLARQAVEGLEAKGVDVVLATNPLFPAVGVQTRLSWLGLGLEDFSFVTTYENASFCKPNPAYYREILEKTGKKPQECLMVGNDGVEDLAALEAGIGVYLITDCLVHGEGADLSRAEAGSFAQFMEYAGLAV